MKPNTLILGASHKSHRFSYQAMLKLQQHGYEPVLVAEQKKTINGLPVQLLEQVAVDIDTVALYINPEKLKLIIDKVIELNPRRVIFNPGTESSLLQNKLHDAGIKAVDDCVLRMLDGDRY